ncbi:hypothetical protein OG586_02335 [Streptomyces murinus]|uniref:hypothetical protein n=1 Tax=Streptomyces murinus TaxID=33900 RepID=UPI002E81F97B|nr:hypothetical protein [Streptomyces murinus]WUD05132.1 hypothetical protein OG586_02335 [Streptomyces murinus]
MNTALRITVFAAALAATFGTAYGVGNAVGTITPQQKGGHTMRHGTSGGPDDMASMPGMSGTSAMPGMRHDAAPGGLELSKDGYTLALNTSQVPAGRKADLSFSIVRDDTGRKVTDCEEQHGRELHFIVASRDLTVYRHLHPTRAADGTWSTPVDLPRAGDYRVFADFTPKGADSLTLGADLSVAGHHEPVEAPAPDTTAKVDGYEVRLAGTPVAGKPSTLTVTVTKDGHPVGDLQPYLGAYGHLVALRSEDLAYLHVHPTGEPGDGTTKPGPEVSFMVTTPTAGGYRLFFDFQHEGKVRTAAFTVHATGARDSAAHEH